MMFLLSFWVLNMSVALLSMKALGFHQKYLNLCSEDEQRSYGFGTTWGWVINDRILIFWVDCPFKHHINQNIQRLAIEMLTQDVVWDCVALGVLLEIIYSIYVLILILNSICTKTQFLSFLFKVFFFLNMKLTHIQINSKLVWLITDLK